MAEYKTHTSKLAYVLYSDGPVVKPYSIKYKTHNNIISYINGVYECCLCDGYFCSVWWTELNEAYETV